MQSLLSPAERHAFQSFLSTMDYPSDTLTATEWAVYNAGPQLNNGQGDPSLLSDANAEQREALTKATKDLMSLDADSWEGNGSSLQHHHSLSPHQLYAENAHQSMGGFDVRQDQHFGHQQQALHHHRQQHDHHELQRQNSFSSSGRDSFSFLHEDIQHGHSSDELRYPSRPDHHLQLLTSSLTGHSDHNSPISPHSPFLFQQQQEQAHRHMSLHQHHQQHQQQQQQPQNHQIHIPTQSYQSEMSPPLSSLSPGSRLRQDSTSSQIAPAGESSSSRNQSGPTTNGRRSGSVGSTNTSGQQQPVSTKQTLLSPSQKKANHIQSEQKRRANIRRGYEALCETVPALREAIREEEEAERNGAKINANGNRKKGRAKKGQKDGDDKDKDRLDGRAGPRSENVVLSKTIDHIQSLLSDRSGLLARLHRARSSLPPGHHALTPLQHDPLWEREWKGGNGKLGDEDPDAEGGSDNEDEGDF